MSAEKSCPALFNLSPRIFSQVVSSYFEVSEEQLVPAEWLQANSILYWYSGGGFSASDGEGADPAGNDVDYSVGSLGESDHIGFLRCLFGDDVLLDHRILVRKVRKGSESSSEVKFSHWLRSAGQAPKLDEISDWYVGLTLAGPTQTLRPRAQVKANAAAGIPGLWADIAVAHPGHRSELTCPPDREAALGFLMDLAAPPTLVVDTGQGHGLNACWLFDKAWLFDDGGREEAALLLGRWHQFLSGRMGDEGWEMENVSDFSHLQRLPGGLNLKEPGNPARVLLLPHRGRRYPREVLEALCAASESEDSGLSLQPPQAEGTQMQVPTQVRAVGDTAHPSIDPDWTPRVTVLPKREDLEYLYHRGAHFLPVWGKGQPAAPGWQLNRASHDEILAHLSQGPDRRGRNPQLGMKPLGLCLALVDLDPKSEASLAKLTDEAVQSCGEPARVVPSRKLWGRHLYYYATPEDCRYSSEDKGGYPNGALFSDKDGEKGDARGTNGYAIIWNPAQVIPQLRDIVSNREPDSHVLSAAALDAIRWDNLKPPAESTGTKGKAVSVVVKDVASNRGEGGHNDARVRAVRDAPEGSRNNTLYGMLIRAHAAGETDMTPYAEAARAAGLAADEIQRALDSAAKSQAAAGSTGGEAQVSKVTLDTLTRPSRENSTEAANALRFLVDHADNLVVAYDEEDPLPADVYGYTTSGTLSTGALQGMLLETSRRHMSQVRALPNKEPGRSEIVRHAQRLDDTRRLPMVIANIRGAIALLRREGLLPESLVIKMPQDMNSNLRYMGAPNGVFDLYTGRLLPPNEARITFTTAQIPDDYDPEATHPDVDVIMPEIPANQNMEWWYKARGCMFARPPARQFVAMITPPNSGKTVWSNCDKDSFGGSYVSSIRPQALQKSDYSGPTSYNNGLLSFGNGKRVLYGVESKGNQDAGLLNLMTGGERDAVVRPIKEAEVRIAITAHLIMQSNLPETGAPELRFGISSHSADTEVAALLSRMYVLPMPVIPEDLRKEEYLEISAPNTQGSTLFRQAWVARTVRQCMAMVGRPWPARLQSQSGALEDLRRREQEPWEGEWLENLLVPAQDAEVHSKSIYANYEIWYEENGGVKLTQRAVTEAVTARYGSGIPEQYRMWNGKRAKVVLWRGLKIRV